MADDKQILREHATSANLQAIGNANELQTWMIGLSEDEDVMLFRNANGFFRLTPTTATLTENSIPFANANGALTQDNTNLNFVDSTNTLNTANMVASGTLNVTGATTLTSASLSATLSVTGTSTLAAMNVSGIANFDSGTLYVDPANGVVGIGQNTPSKLLDIGSAGNPGQIGLRRTTDGSQIGLIGINAAGSGDFVLDILNSGGGGDIRLASSNSIVSIYTNGAERFCVKNNGDSFFNGGNVGIDTSSPAYKLEVNGTLGVSDDVDISGIVTLTSANNIVTNIGDPQISKGTLNGELRLASGSGSGGNIEFFTGTGTVLQEVARFQGDKLGVGTLVPDRTIHAQNETATTNAINYTSRLTSTCSATVTSGFGVGMEYELENNGGVNRIAATASASWDASTNGNESTGYTIAGYDSGTSGVTLARFSRESNGEINLGVGNRIYASSGNIKVETSGIMQFEKGISLKEITSGSFNSGYGTLYTKTDNNLYFIDGANNTKTVMTAEDRAYANIYAENVSSAVSVTTANTFYQITAFNTDGPEKNANGDHTNDHITVPYTGNYRISFSCSFSGTANTEFFVEVLKNNGATEIQQVHGHRKIGAGGDVGNCGGTGVASLTANDTVELWITSTSNSVTATIEDVSLVVEYAD